MIQIGDIVHQNLNLYYRVLDRISFRGDKGAYATLHRAGEKSDELDTVSDDIDLRTLGLFYCNIFYDKSYESLSLDELIFHSNKIQFELTESDCEYIQLLSSQQAKSVYWYRFRAGIITASNFKRACRTSIENPSITLVKQICYPEDTKFYSHNTQYGCDHEEEAYNKLNEQMIKLHSTKKWLDCYSTVQFWGQSSWYCILLVLRIASH